MRRRILFFVTIMLTALLMIGCAFQTVDEMYALPKRSEEYKYLQAAIDSSMSGMEYCAPLSGEHQQAVQMADLTGDGVEEYLVFAKGSSDKPLQILIFAQGDDGEAKLLEVIESNGSAFEQVEYVQVDGIPGFELVIGRQVSDQVLRNVSMYSFADGNARQLMSAAYSKFLTCDLDSDACSELMIIQPGEADIANAIAVLYDYRLGEMERSLEAELSRQVGNIKRIMVSKLYNGSPAVYVASAVDESAIVTDIFALRNDRFTNISIRTESGTSVQTLRNFYVYSDDVDDDGILELPSLITMKPISQDWEQENQYLIRWFAMDIDGQETDKLYSFHNYVGGWYVQLDSLWAGRVTVDQFGNTFIFYVWDPEFRELTALFTIYALTGSDRETQATEERRFALHRTEGVVYAGKLESGAESFGITEEILINSFRLIYQDWETGET